MPGAMQGAGSRTGRQFLSFGVIGAVGFVVDVAVLYAALHGLATGYYLGRLLSYLAAASTTWYLNRHFTFARSEDDGLLVQWLTFLLVNAFGGLVNYAVYCGVIYLAPEQIWTPAAAVAAGSISGLALNFISSKKLVFERAARVK